MPVVPGLPSGVFPYLSAGTSLDDLRMAVANYGFAVASGRGGAEHAGKVDGLLLDPATYVPESGRADDSDAAGMFAYDCWLERQRAAHAPVLFTDSRRIRPRDRSALRAALARWGDVPEPVLVVLPIESWWLRAGLACLVAAVRQAGRPVALVLLNHSLPPMSDRDQR